MADMEFKECENLCFQFLLFGGAQRQVYPAADHGPHARRYETSRIKELRVGFAKETLGDAEYDWTME